MIDQLRSICVVLIQTGIKGENFSVRGTFDHLQKSCDPILSQTPTWAVQGHKGFKGECPGFLTTHKTLTI